MCEIRQARKQDLETISRIHKKSYSKIHFTSYFSLSLIKILGFVVCGKNIVNQLTLFKKEQRLEILKTAILNPIIVLKKVIISIFNKYFNNKTDFYEADFLILSIVSSGEEKGIGTLLLNHVEKYGLTKGINKVGLYVRISNISAINAYLKNGYKINGYISGQYYMEQNN